MKKLSRKTKLLLWVLIFLVSVGMILASSETNSPTAEIAFRKAEKQRLIGPAEIIDTIDFQDSAYDHMMLGRSDYGYTFFEWRKNSGWDEGNMTYVPKNGGATIYCTYNSYGTGVYDESWLPIFAFVDNPAAIHAKLTLETIQDEEMLQYILEADKNEQGYFLFSLKTYGMRGQDFTLIQQLIARQYKEYRLEGSASATITLYDSSGNLLESYQFSK